MATTSPVIGSALQVIALMAVEGLGDYTHPDENIQAFIRTNFEQMAGSLALSIEELMSAYPLGYAVSQWGIEQRDGQWMLQDIQILHPADYHFEGKRGKIESIKWRGSGDEVAIPYGGEDGRVIHCVNARHLSFRSPTGIATLKRINAAWKAWKIVVGEMLVAAQRQATPILAGYSDSAVSVPLYGPDGRTPLVDEATGEPVVVPAPVALLEQLSNLDNRSVISTDLQNKIEAIASQVGGDFFFKALTYLQQLQLMGLIFPETILTSTGVGDSNLNKGQRTTLGQVIESLLSQIKESLIENCIRWLIYWNFGEQESYGSFVVPEDDDTNRIELFAALNNAVSSGWFSAADLEVLNKGRELVGLPAKEAIDAVPEPATMSRLFSSDYWRNAG